MSQGDLFAPRARRPIDGAWALAHGSYQAALYDTEWDACITDPPYSERTHRGHDDGAELAEGRAALPYSSWSQNDVLDFVGFVAPRTRGWFVACTDHVLAPVYEHALRACGRYVFSPIAFVAPGSRVRLTGDGPAQWTCWLIVARPRALSRWGALPGAYVLPKGDGERGNDRIPGQKPLWLMRELVRDYSREGDLVCDPCAGSGTTLLAARLENRVAIGAERNMATHRLAQSRLERELGSAAH